jgi:hypothetical protein
MNSYLALFVAPLVLLVAVAGCGGGGGFNPNNVTVAVSPATATIPANGQVTLQATVNGLCSTCTPAIFLWSVTAGDSNGDSGCDWFTTPPSGPCPSGTIQETAGGNTLTVTYFAPSTAGTYHIVAEWSGGFGSPVTKDGTSVISVSP